MSEKAFAVLEEMERQGRVKKAEKNRKKSVGGQLEQQSLVEKERSLPESFWQPIGKEGTIEYLSTRYGLHVDMLDQ